MSDETKKTRAKPRPRDYGLLMMVQVIVPVNRSDLKDSIRVSETVDRAQSTGSLDEIMQLPGVRFALTARPPRFGTLPRPGEPAATEASEDGGQRDIEEFTGGEGGGSAATGESVEEQPAAEEQTGRRRGARAA